MKMNKAFLTFALLIWPQVALSQPAPAAPVAPEDVDQIEDMRLIHGVQAAVRVYSKDPVAAHTAAQAALNEIARIYDKYDLHTHESEATAINSAADHEEVLVSDETFSLLTRMLDLCRRSNGAYDPTVASYDFLWNFAIRPFVRPLPDEIAVRRKLTGCDKVILKPGTRAVRTAMPGTRITFAGVLHGFAMERTSEVLRKAGLHDFRIRVGNDVFAQGRVGTRHWLTGAPNTRKLDGEPLQVYLTSQAAVTVSDSDHFVYRNGKRYHDAIDPRSGMPAEGVIQATVIGTDPTMTGAMAHALFVLGPKAGFAMLAHDKQAEGFLVDTTGKIWMSPAMSEYAHLPVKMPTE
jgi:thiamine biosynthesis lipoprotein